MSPLAWLMVVVLVGLLTVAVAVGTPVGDLSFALAGLLVALALWLGVGRWVQADARRRGIPDDRSLDRVVMVGGVFGLIWYLGYRRGRLEAAPGESESATR